MEQDHAEQFRYNLGVVGDFLDSENDGIRPAFSEVKAALIAALEYASQRIIREARKARLKSYAETFLNYYEDNLNAGEQMQIYSYLPALNSPEDNFREQLALLKHFISHRRRSGPKPNMNEAKTALETMLNTAAYLRIEPSERRELAMRGNRFISICKHQLTNDEYEYYSSAIRGVSNVCDNLNKYSSLYP